MPHPVGTPDAAAGPAGAARRERAAAQKLQPAAAPALSAALGLTAGGGAATHKLATTTTRARSPNTAAAVTTTATSDPKRKPTQPPAYPRLLPAVTQPVVTPFVAAMTWRGRTAGWIARPPTGVSLLSFDQRLVELHLHSGSTDAGTLRLALRPVDRRAERRELVAAFNGAFRFSTGAGGFVCYGRIGPAPERAACCNACLLSSHVEPDPRKPNRAQAMSKTAAGRLGRLQVPTRRLLHVDLTCIGISLVLMNTRSVGEEVEPTVHHRTSHDDSRR